MTVSQTFKLFRALSADSIIMLTGNMSVSKQDVEEFLQNCETEISVPEIFEKAWRADKESARSIII